MEVQSSQSINQSVWCVELSAPPLTEMQGGSSVQPSAPPQTETQGGGGVPCNPR